MKQRLLNIIEFMNYAETAKLLRNTVDKRKELTLQVEKEYGE
ncbi:hypothetical protein HMPREF0083_00875 [Aneurinibacillus aneurinilyticus ATCC 12856]|uniref:Uncharacterized protein n=1 Tax=Aneurinibacillus aneurinilyticus ATCC 12856 TaxID=649747 RepID=U1WQY6_ANEAE|nr:hypothetical protein HMPREF0083_00875 [Aneurinibacillus aneurinilyticus ATCC 12856]